MTSTTQLLWSCTSNNLNLSDPSIRLTSIDAQNLVIAADVLDSDTIYTFELIAIETALNNTVRGRSSTIISTNAAPARGSCLASSSTISYDQSVTLSCYDWTDKSTDFPLQYSFGYMTDQGLQTVVGFFQTASEMSTLLPIGSSSSSSSSTSSSSFSVQASSGTDGSGDDYVRPLYIDIMDKWGATTRVDLSVIVTPPLVNASNPTGSLTQATESLSNAITEAVLQADASIFVSSMASLTSILSYFATATANSSAVYASNGVLADVYSSYLTANKSMELRLAMFNSLMDWSNNDQRPASAATVTEALSVLNALLSAPAELGISTSLTTNDTEADQIIRITLREAAGSLLYNLALLAYSNPNVTFTSEMGDILVSGLDSVAASSLADSSPSDATYINGTTSLQREQKRNAMR
jgi:hypothetical protein